MEIERSGNTYSVMKKNSNKGITIIEALVSMVIVGIGIASLLSLSAYLIKSTDISLTRNKVNFLSEMMMETLIASEGSFTSQSYALNKTDCTYSYQNDFQKIWLDTFKNILNTNTTGSRCLAGDEKIVEISNNGLNVVMQISTGGGKQKKHLGYSKIE